MEDIINNFPNKDDVLDFVNKIFDICESSQCVLLQCCNKILLNFLYIFAQPFLDSDIREETLMCNVSTVFKLFSFFQNC